MQRIVFVVFTLLFFFSTNLLFGQTATNSKQTNLLESSSNLLNLDNEDWSFFVDEENRIYYIDFETIKVNLSDIIVKNENGKVVLKEDVVDLPVNTIYEIDFSTLGAGNYDIELRSFTQTFEKEVQIR